MNSQLLFLSALLVLSGNIFAQGANCGKQVSLQPETVASADTLFVRKTGTPVTDTYELVFYGGGKSTMLYSLVSEDGSYIKLLMRYENELMDYECLSVYNNTADGNRFLFFDRINKRLYLTCGCYMSYYYPMAESVDFAHRKVLLENRSSMQVGVDTLKAGSSTVFVGSGKAKYIETELEYLLAID